MLVGRALQQPLAGRVGLLLVELGQRVGPVQQLVGLGRQRAVVVRPLEELYLVELQIFELYLEIEYHSLSSSVI